MYRLLMLASLSLACSLAGAAAPYPQDAAMLAAARDGEVEKFRLALKEGANIYARDAGGGNVLEMAMLSDSDRMISEVMQQRPDIDIRGSSGFTPLGLAVVRNNEKMLHRLIRAGADLNRTDATGASPLLSAMRLGREEFVQALLEAGARVDRADMNGTTPLHVACERGDIALVRRLLARGADPNALDGSRQPPVLTALLNNHAEIAELLLFDPHTDPVLATQSLPPRREASGVARRGPPGQPIAAGGGKPPG